MKTRAVLIVLLFGLLGILAWLIWSQRDANRVAEAKPSDAAALARKPMVSPTGKNTLKPDIAEQLHEIMNDANRPISFFGQVIDQDANPIPGVKVTLQIRRTKEVGPIGIGDTFDYPTLTTDGDGRFSLMGAKGAVLAVKSLEKSGYEPSVKALRSSYWYWREPKDAFRPNAERPEIFRMWKKAGAEKLVDCEKMTRIPYDGTSVTFDLLNGERVQSGGDLRVTLERNPHQVSPGQRNYEWSLTVEAVDGGVVESSDEQMFRAPTQGYQPKLVVHMSADDQNWTDEKSVALYFKSRGGKHYGSMELEVNVGSDKPTTGLSFHSFMNPNGSQNLEYDPLQDAKKGP